MSFSSPIYVKFKFNEIEHEGEYFPYTFDPFGFYETEREDDDELVGHIRPFNIELRKNIIKRNEKIHKTSYQEWCTKGDVIKMDAFVSSDELSVIDNALLVTDVQIVSRDALKTPLDTVNDTRSELLNRMELLLNNIIRGKKNIIHEKKVEQVNIDTDLDKEQKIKNSILAIIFITGAVFGFLESIPLGMLWIISGAYIYELQKQTKPLTKQKYIYTLERIIEAQESELETSERDLSVLKNIQLKII